MKKWLTVSIMLICVLLCASATADWLCPEILTARDGSSTVCGYVNEDDCGWCQWCGADEPVHGFTMSMVGKSFIRVKWHGELKEQVMLLWCVSGTNEWEMTEVSSGTTFNLKDLQPGTAYDIMLMLQDDTTVGPITVSTAGGATPTPEPTAEPTPIPTPASTATPGPTRSSGDYEYRVLGDGTAELTQYHGTETAVQIPSGFDGYTLSGIGDWAFCVCDSLTSITIPDSVTYIGDYAISYCFQLTSVTIPASVTSIGSYAFTGCYGLTAISIPNSVAFMGSNPFRFCNVNLTISPDNPYFSMSDGALISHTDHRLVFYSPQSPAAEFIIPDGVASIDNYAFSGCDNLTSITIPDSVTLIGSCVFQNCTNLISLSIPESVTFIGSNPFTSCEQMALTISPNNVSFSMVDGALISHDDHRLIYYSDHAAAPQFTIPDGVTTIGDDAFYDCVNLTSITIPDSVTDIGVYAFASCSSLTSITIPDSVVSIGGGAFEFCFSLKSITIPDSVTFIDDAAFNSCDNLTVRVTPGSYAEQWCKDNNQKYTTN